MAEVRSLSAHQTYELLGVGLRCLDLLALDELWTDAAKTSDKSAPVIGNQMIRLMRGLSTRSGEVGKLLLATRSELNAYWPQLRDFWQRTAEREISALDSWLSENDEQLGDAGVYAAKDLQDGLAEEAELLAAKIAELKTGSASGGDLSKKKKFWLGVLAACCLASVALPVIAGAMGAGALAAGAFTGVTQLAGVGAGFAGSALIGPGDEPRRVLRRRVRAPKKAGPRKRSQG